MKTKKTRYKPWIVNDCSLPAVSLQATYLAAGCQHFTVHQDPQLSTDFCLSFYVAIPSRTVLHCRLGNKLSVTIPIPMLKGQTKTHTWRCNETITNHRWSHCLAGRVMMNWDTAHWQQHCKSFTSTIILTSINICRY